MTKGRSIRLFLVDGTPGGIITAEIMNWTGHVMTAPRSRLADLIQREEAGRTGVYVLLGDNPAGGHRPMLYIGESDTLDARLRKHTREKDFWDRVCVVTSKDQNLTKAHAKYLESRLIAMTRACGRVILENVATPEYARLPDADIADMEFFIEQIRLVLPVLGMDFLRDPTAPATATGPRFELTSPKHDLRAEAQEVDGDFVVLAGSQAQAAWIGVATNYTALHQSLIADGVLVADGPGTALRFSRDYAFSKPSAAAAVILGRSSNGRLAWRVKGSKTTYAQWQDGQITAPARQEAEE